MGNSTKITIRRPDGTIETVIRHETFGKVIEQQMIAATRKAGRGEILSFEVISPTVTDEQRLLSERRQLVGDVQAAIDDQSDAYETAHARQDVLAEQIKTQHEPAIAAARAAVQAFDATHPEIVAAIRAEKQERAERFMRQD